MGKIKLPDEYTVATFCHTGAKGKIHLSDVTAYTLWYNPEWPGCVVYRVIANSGAEARKLARRARLQNEIDKALEKEKADRG